MTAFVFDEFAINHMVRTAKAKRMNAPAERVEQLEADLRDRIDTLKGRGDWRLIRARLIAETTAQEIAA